ncbi:hypothetical protein BGZ80_011654 [Entomortierella chlamydospora]|uniref:Transcription activator GCR1-like domain-containing protein n=1 Tax=Entomortierella chlamydospora TaxID=101097 RepID=A0A9P6SZ47_9FUNG|nr:hypothetical protein BGZ79_001631 [Entomortierella chlamydospora]KAG0012571.1 hypothetical protein BGZ80_011654 [Entomortierella chlamydospora]
MPVQTRRSRHIVSKTLRQKPSDPLMPIDRRVHDTTPKTSKKKAKVHEEQQPDQEEEKSEKALVVQSWQTKDMDEWTIMKSMEDQGIMAWKNWCKFQDMSSTVDPRKVILYIDGYVLPRENALLQKVYNDAHHSRAKGRPATARTSSAPAIPVSMIEILIRPVMRLWANQNKKEKYSKRSRHPHFLSDSSPEANENTREALVEQEQEPAHFMERIDSSTMTSTQNHQTGQQRRASSPLERNSASPPNKRWKPYHPLLTKTLSNLSSGSFNESNHNHNDRPSESTTEPPFQEVDMAGDRNLTLASETLSDQAFFAQGSTRSHAAIPARKSWNEAKPYINVFVEGKLPRTLGSQEVDPKKVVKYSLQPYQSTVPGLYRQWTESRGDMPSVVSLNGTLGVSWRQDQDLEYYELGVRVMMEVARLASTYRLSISQALGLMEDERRARKVSIRIFTATLVKQHKLRMKKTKGRKLEEIYRPLTQLA